MASAEVLFQSYGKSQVRVSHIRRDGDQHQFIELTCSIELAGDFDAAYTAGDNASVVPTDTMKNTVYVLARRHGIESLEAFTTLLAEHFLQTYSQVEMTTVHCEETHWERITLDGKPHPHAFTGGNSERATCEATATDDGTSLIVGIQGLPVLKTTGSEFVGYPKDEYTTLPETKDRIFATTIQANWPTSESAEQSVATHAKVREQLLNVFAAQHSLSVQHTLFDMAKAVFDACGSIDEITISMPNQHHLLAKLEPFGLDNENLIFVPTDEPYGDISATIGRSSTATGDDSAGGNA